MPPETRKYASAADLGDREHVVRWVWLEGSPRILIPVLQEYLTATSRPIEPFGNNDTVSLVITDFLKTFKDI